jgi:hypothetical protein
MTRHIAHFNWATLVADLGDRAWRPSNAVPKVNAMAEAQPRLSSGAAARRGGKGVRHRLAALHGKSALIASFSVWETPEHFRDYVYKTVHGAFFRRGHEWFEPDAPRGHVLWWVDARGTSPTSPRRATGGRYTRARRRAGGVRLGWLDAQAA